MDRSQETRKDVPAPAESDPPRPHELLGFLAHDLRSPLCAILLNSSVISESANEVWVRGVAEDVSKAARQMERLLADLFDASRIDSGLLGLVRKQLDARDLVLEVAALQTPLCLARGISLAVDLPDSAVPATLDRARVVQALSNLVLGFIHGAPSKGAISLRLTPRRQEIELAVSDGLAAAPTTVSKRPFKRVSPNDRQTRSGLGIGMHICRLIVAAHGGRLWEDSDADHAQAFHFSLPRGAAAERLPRA